MKENTHRIPCSIPVGGALLIAVALTLGMVAPVSAETYTRDADFDQGIMVGIDHLIPDQLQLSPLASTLPYLWVPNLEGTVSRVDIRTGRELGRYRVVPARLAEGGSPSRTTVDLQGNCWVGTRQAGTVVKIGLPEAGGCPDRNSDGIITTSRDRDGDGDITGDELLPWGGDECVLHEVVLIPGKEGTYVPGTYSGGYDTNYWGTSPRGLAVDRQNNFWAGTWNSHRYYYIDGVTGTILKEVDVSAVPLPEGGTVSHWAYGAVIDRDGILWSSSLSTHILRLDPSDLNNVELTAIPIPEDYAESVYGIALDYAGHLFVTGHLSNTLVRVSLSTRSVEWKRTLQGMDDARGVACTPDNHVWVASSNNGKVIEYDNEGNYLGEVSGFNFPVGVAVDGVGKLWVPDRLMEPIHRVDPATMKKDLSRRLIGSVGHYSYSDMTGIIARSITTKTGTWTVIDDSGAPGTPWETVSWHGETPPGTSVTVRVRSSEDGKSWSAWEAAENDVPLTATPDGRLLQIEVTLKNLYGDVSPVLYDLTVRPANLPPDISTAAPSIDCLWPPDHTFVNLAITGVTDPDGDPVTITVDAITSDEPTATDEGSGGKSHAPDAEGVGTPAPRVRAERSGDGNGRVYGIAFTASDGKPGGSRSSSVSVCVPHDKSDGCTCTDDGQEYDATVIT